VAAIFISYRDADASGHAGRLVDNLEDKFGPDRVLHDKTTLTPGADWKEWIERAILGSAMVVVVIGTDWDDEQNLERIRDPDDVLRWEIELALGAAIPIVPVLINRTKLPSRSALPGSLHRLADAQTLQIHDADWRQDVKPLFDVVLDRFARLAEQPQPRPVPAPGQAWPDALREALSAVESRSPILIAVDTDEDPLDEDVLPRTQRHMTVTFTEAELERVLRAAAGVLDGPVGVDELVRASRRVWQELERAQPRLADLIGRIAGTGCSQPVSWCGRSALLARLRQAVLIAHTGDGFVSVDAGAHYFLPVSSEDRTVQPRRDGEPGVELVDIRGTERGPQRLHQAVAEQIAVVVDPDELVSTCRSLAMLVRASPVSPTRALLAFGPDEPDAGLVDELLAHLPCLAFGDDGLAGGTFLGALEDALRDHGETLPVPCILAAVRAAFLAEAMPQAHLRDTVRALTWSTWSWVGLPLFSSRYDEVAQAAYPHLLDLRSVASSDWYFDRRAGPVAAYEADRLARADTPSDERFHLYLSGAGGTGKSCFLRHVHDRIRDQPARAAVWYRVDAPSSQWEDIDRRLREETLKALEPHLNGAGVALERRGGTLGEFLLETVKQARGVDEIVIFLDQLERTFESGDEPEPWRLASISQKLTQLLDEVGIGKGVRVFVASRKQYLPDFLVSSRNAGQCGLEFNVLQTISEGTEQEQFINRVLGWAKKERLVHAQLGIPGDVARELARQVDGHPLNMMLALIELLSAHRNTDRTLTVSDLNDLGPWARLFALDLRAAVGDDLAWYVLLAMAHARTEIVRFEEVWWRVRMVDPRLTKRADDLRSDGIVERLWLFGHLGRTIHARPYGDDPARFVEFFHANLRDFLLRDVMAQGGADLDLPRERCETPPAWRALDRLSGCAHDWEQTPQLLPSDDVRALMKHRFAVVDNSRERGAETGPPFQLLFLRDHVDTRARLSAAAAECFVFSALVHDDSGRWAFERLFPDVSDRVARCQEWLRDCSADSRPAILRYLVELESRDAGALIARYVTDESAVGAEVARALAEILVEPLFAAGHRDRIVATLLESALADVQGEVNELPARVPGFVVAACDGDRDTLALVLGNCAGRLGSSENRAVRTVGGEFGSSALLERWLEGTASRGDQRGRRVAQRTAPRRSVIGIALGRGLEVGDEGLASWSAELRERLGVPVPELQRFLGDSDDYELEFRVQGRRVATGLFRPAMLCVPLRRWGDDVPPEAIKSYDEASGQDVLWLDPALAGQRPDARDFHEAVADWLEAFCRRSFDVLFDRELALAFVRDVLAQSGRSRAVLSLPQVRQAVVDLIEENVPFAQRREALFNELIELGPTLTQPDRLTLRLRDSVKADICRAFVDEAGQMATILLEDPLERVLGDRIGSDREGRDALRLSPGEAVELADAVRRRVLRVLAEDGPPPVVVTVPRLRQALARLLRRFDHRIRVLSFTELEPDIAFVPGGLVDAPGLLAR
jgi:hypothetical protein